MEVFVFPLVNVTLFPHTTKPLNVFEPRYLAMIKDAVATKTPVAVAFIDDPTKVGPVQPGGQVPFVRELAGFGYPQIVEERLNGTLLIFLQGQGKLRLGKVLDRNTPYIVCEGHVIPEVNEVLKTQQSSLDSLYRTLTRWIENHIPEPSQRDIFLRNIKHPQDIVGTFSSYLVRDYDMQQMVLEYDDINEKIQFLQRLMESNELTL